MQACSSLQTLRAHDRQRPTCTRVSAVSNCGCSNARNLSSLVSANSAARCAPALPPDVAMNDASASKPAAGRDVDWKRSASASAVTSGVGANPNNATFEIDDVVGKCVFFLVESVEQKHVKDRLRNSRCQLTVDIGR